EKLEPPSSAMNLLLGSVLLSLAVASPIEVEERFEQHVDAMQPGETPPSWPTIVRTRDGARVGSVYIQTFPGRAYLPDRSPAPAQDPVPATASSVEQQEP
ncbi:hypothetical protein PRIPAC_88255, partial [Pristionchus pacificus]|uniref:Uncharacterized protein n=1 Tax=Pristionchus pacificus TaxID=54126 RepID=A0A2A6CVE6_PRIPA